MREKECERAIIKKIFIMGVLLIMAFTLFACQGNKDRNKIDIAEGNEDSGKIDVGGEIMAGKPSSATAVRVVLDDDVFLREDNVKMTAGFGFLNADTRYNVVDGTVLAFTVEAQNFLITSDEGEESGDIYKKVFEDCSDSKFVCTKKCSSKGNRYSPNYYETFTLKMNPVANPLGTIWIRAMLLFSGGDRDGGYARLYYATNDKKIAFSSISIADAQEKLN